MSERRRTSARHEPRRSRPRRRRRWRVPPLLRGFLRNPMHTGAIAPSSAKLAEMITETACIQKARVVVELGTGTGVFTEAILSKLPEQARFLGIELDRVFASLTRSRCPGARILRGNATHLRAHLETEGLDGCDAIISGLPWAAFPDALQECLLDAVVDALHPGGRFATFAYLQGLLLPAGRRFRAKLESRFAEIGTTSIVWRNLPPAFVYWGDKAS